MTKKLISIVLALSTLAFASCAKYEQESTVLQSTIIIDSIEEIYMHLPGAYTLTVRNKDGSMSYRSVESDYVTIDSIRLYDDVPADSFMWVIEKQYYNATAPTNSTSTYICLELHIHDPSSIQGGAWKRGKTGRGQTQIVGS